MASSWLAVHQCAQEEFEAATPAALAKGFAMSEEYGFSDAVRSDDLLFCSGQIGLAGDGTVPLDPDTQYALAFAALGRVLATEGCTAADIVDMTTFHTRYPNHMDVFMAQKAEFLGAARPAWTAIGVAALGFPDSLVEIKAVARIPR